MRVLCLAANAAGQILKITYGNGVVTDYSYNPLTLRLDELQSNGPAGLLQHFQYAFDAVGNVQSITDYVHTATQTFGYDDLNRLTQASGSYGAFTYAYDAIGNMLLKDGTQTMTYGENGAGPHAVTSVQSPVTSHQSLTYDANGNLLAKTPTGPTGALLEQRFQYDAESRLVRADTPQERTVSVTFQPGWNFFSLPVIPDDPSVATLFPTFSADFEQLADYDDSTGTFSHYLGADPKFDDFSTLTYGEGYQLYCANPNGVTLSFTGKAPTQSLNQSLSAGWHLLSSISTGTKGETVGQVLAGIAYGQLLRYDTQSSSLTTVASSELAQVGAGYYVEVLSASTWIPPLPEDVTTTTVYDGDGGRTKLTTAAGTTRFLGESVEMASDGTVTKYVFAGSQRIAAISESPVTGHQSRFYHGDHLGSSNVITDGAGALIELAEYTPYGSLATQSGSANVAHKFTGQRLDVSTGLYFYHARYYDPQLGRFISPDTIVQAPGDPQTLNRYAYARNNPVRFIDPSGHFFWFFAALFSLLGSLFSAATSFLAAGLSFLGSTFSGILGGLKATFAVYSGFAIQHPIITGALVGGFQGGYSANQAGGNIFAGIAFGATAGALGGYLGGQLAGLAPGGAIGQAAVQGGFAGASSGAAAGFAGGKGSLSDVAKGLASGAIRGAAVAGAIAIASDVANRIYNKIAPYEATWAEGGEAVKKDRYTLPVEGANNIGTQGGPVDPNGLFNEGGILSRSLNEIPGVNAVPGVHDVFQVRLDQWGGKFARAALNVPGMLPAAGITYTALLATPGAQPFLMYGTGFYVSSTSEPND